MFIHNINPVLASFGQFQIRYYGLFIVIDVIFTYFIIKYLAKKKGIDYTTEEVQDLMLWGVAGIFIGARVFYVLFYNLPYYSSHLWEVFAFWKGGLSFHGGIVGLIVGVFLFTRYKKKDFLAIGDVIAIPACLALALGRFANFLNGELVGRVTTLPWGVNFGGETDKLGNLVYRHPSQLYESAKNLVIFATLWTIKDFKKLKKGTLFALFVIMYSTMRFFIEFVREPDPQVGFVAFNFLTMGQVLNIVMLICGIGLMIYVWRRKE